MELPGRDPSIEVKQIDENKYTISISVSPDQIHSFSVMGLDMSTMISNVALNEVYLTINKLISKAVFSKENDSSEPISNLNDLKLLLEAKNGFAITNVHVGSLLQDSVNMEITPIADTLNNDNGCMYQIGKYKDNSIYVDPYMRWEDNRCVVVENNFYNYSFNPDGSLNISNENNMTSQHFTMDLYFKNINPISTIINVNSNDLNI